MSSCAAQIRENVQRSAFSVQRSAAQAAKCGGSLGFEEAKPRRFACDTER